MASNIFPDNIDITYPIAGQDNDTQGFRTNFTNIRNNFVTAASEITAIQGNVATLQVYGNSSFASIVAGGNSQATATPITTQVTKVTSASAGTGILLPTPTYPGQIVYIDAGENSLNGVYLYPSAGGQIDEAGINNPVLLATSAYWIGICESVNPPQWASWLGQFTGLDGIQITYSNGGTTVGFGPNVSIPSNVTISGTTALGSALQLANISLAQRNTITPENGMLIYNNTFNTFQGYANGTWGNITLV